MNQDNLLVSLLRNWVEVVMRFSIHELMQYSRESGLSIQQIRVLFHIHECPRGITNIGEHLGITKAAASQMIDKMVEQGFITRVEDSHDRRANILILPKKEYWQCKGVLKLAGVGLKTLHLDFHILRVTK